MYKESTHAEQESNVRARGIMYHSRMRFLRSRENIRQGESNQLSLAPYRKKPSHAEFLSPKIPCAGESLLPPSELMTRAKSFRMAYVNNNPKKEHARRIRRMSCLTKKEDPVICKRRMEILSRIRAAEASMERINQEKEAKSRAEMRRSVSSNRKSNPMDPDIMSKEKTLLCKNGKTVPQQYKKTEKGHEGKKEMKPFEVSDIRDKEDSFPDEFSFISDWSRPKKKYKQKKFGKT